MKTIAMITISGSMFLFDNNLNEKECIALQVYADSEKFRKSIDYKDEQSILLKFMNDVQNEMTIFLKPIKISCVIRIQPMIAGHELSN